MGWIGELVGAGVKLFSREAAETGTKVVAEDAATLLAKKTAEEEAARLAAQQLAARHLLEQQTLEATHLAERQALERGGADLTGAAVRGSEPAVANAAATGVKKSVNVLTDRASWMIYYGSKDMTLAQKLAVLGERGEDGYVKLLVDNARKKGITQVELTEIQNLRKLGADGKPLISDAMKQQFQDIFDARNGKNFIGRGVADLKGSLTYAWNHPGRAGLSAVYNTATGVARTTAKTVWFSIRHPWLAAAGLGAAEVADQTLLNGAVTHTVGTHVVDPLLHKAETAIDNKVQKAIGWRPFSTNADGSPSTPGNGSGNGNGNGNGSGSDNNSGGHWYDWLKNMASSLTGGWAWLGMILSVVAWIAEQVTSLAGSLFSKDTKVQTNNPNRVAAVAGTDPNMSATVINHNGQQQPSIFDQLVPQLAPAPAPT